MEKNRALTCILLTALVVPLIISCAHREEAPDVRTNPYDPGSSKWTENTAPVITVAVDSLWYDFNHSASTGTIRLHLHEDDRNFPYDTIAGSIFSNGSEIKLPRSAIMKDTTILLSGIKPGKAAQCTVAVYDSKQSVISRVLGITVPDSFPARPPLAGISISSQQVSLTWTKVPDVKYIVYYSDSLKGLYTDSIIVNQTSSSTVTVYNQPSGYFPRYYIVATTNKFGTARSSDTLVGRKYYDGITPPNISSASKGIYSTYIGLSIYNPSSNYTDHIEIYRSINDTNAFRLLKEIANSSHQNFYDTVQTSANYYYKVISVDNQGRCSFPSAAVYGYLQRLSPPSLSFQQYFDYIRLSWTKTYGAVKYRVYRSDNSCGNDMKLIVETNDTSCTDTLPTGDYYYYTVCAVSNTGFEGSRSPCMPSKISVLPPPDSISIAPYKHPFIVVITWNRVDSAQGYIVHRYSNYMESVLDTVESTVCIDSTSNASSYSYRVAAFNKKGSGIFSTNISNPKEYPPIMKSDTANDSLFLTMINDNTILKYYVYSSTDYSNYILLDSVEKHIYIIPLVDFQPKYYRYEIRTTYGLSNPSQALQFKRTLNTPTIIHLTEVDGGIKIQWNKVNGAEKYVVIRSPVGTLDWYEGTTTDTFLLDLGLSGYTHYQYLVSAKNTYTQSSFSKSAIDSREIAPQTPISVTISSQINSIILSWSMPSDGSKPTGFNIYRSTNSTSFKRIGSTQSYQYIDTVPDTLKYYYMITAYNTKGESVKSNSYSATLLRPSPPQNLTGSIATLKSHIEISWTPVDGITRYVLFRAPSAFETATYLGSVENTNFYYDSTCNVNTKFYYKIASIVSGIQSPLSVYTVGIRLGPPLITSVDKYANGMDIRWNAQTYTVQHYNIYRSESFTGPYIKIDSTTSNSYRDIVGNAFSFYKVSSVNVVESDLSNASTNGNLNLTFYGSASQGTKTNMIDISWAAVSGAIAYRIYRAPTDTFDRNITRIAEVIETMYTDAVQSDSVYYYKITTLTTTGESDLSTSALHGYRYPTAKPFPPSNVYTAHDNSGIFIGWYPPPKSVGYDKYNIYRSSTLAGPFSKTITVPTYSTDTYVDTLPLKGSTVYWYYITTLNQRGESVPSDTVSGSY